MHEHCLLSLFTGAENAIVFMQHMLYLACWN